MEEFNEEVRRAELEREVAEKSKTLWEKLVELINAWRGRNAYKALEQIKENLEVISHNNEATAEAMEKTAEVLEELINTTSKLGSRLNDMSEAEIESELKKIDEKIASLKNQELDISAEEVNVEKSLNDYKYMIAFDECDLYMSKTYNSLYLHDKQNNVYYQVVESAGLVTFALHDIEVESEKRLKLEPITLSEDETLDNLTKIRYAIMENYYENWENPSKYSDEQKTMLSDLEKKREEKQKILETVNKLKGGIETDMCKGTMLDDGAFCIEHKDKNAMVKFFKNEGKISAYLYTDYDKETLKPLSKGVIVGKWENNKDGQVNADIHFDRQYIVRDIIRSDVAEQYFALYGLQTDDIKAMLKEEGVKSFKKVNKEEIIAKYQQMTDDINKSLPEGYRAKFIQEDVTYISITSPNNNTTYINFMENGNVNQYAYKYNNENEPKTVSDRGVTIVRENRANQEDFKVSVKAYEECMKALEREQKKEQQKEAQKSEAQKKSRTQERD